MRAHVYLQKCSAMELLVAVLTVVLFLALHLSRVCAQMLSQVVLATEHASTHLQANACKLLRCITRYLFECTPRIKTDITVTQQLQNRLYCQLYVTGKGLLLCYLTWVGGAWVAITPCLDHVALQVVLAAKLFLAARA